MRAVQGVMLVALAIDLIACGGNPTTSPSPQPTSSPAPSPAPVPATGTLAALVRDDTGVPVGGANITALVGRAPFAQVRTDVDGSFRLDNLTLGAIVTIRVTKVPFEESESQFQVQQANTLTVTLHVLQQTTVRGVVRDRDTGMRIAGAKLFFENSPGAFVNAGREMFAAADGSYVFDHIYVGNANIRTSAAGYNDWVKGLNISGPTTLDFDLSRIEQPVIYSGRIGGPRETWTCVIPAVSGTKFYVPEKPCATFPLNMRRLPATFTATLTWGPVEGSMSFQLVCASTGWVDKSVSSDPTTERLLTLSGFATCDTLRVVKNEYTNTPVNFTVSVVRAD